jgi:histidine triad (HIT) family protein
MNEKTVFEKIIDREIPADIVYEDERVIAFLDIEPINKGHTLVVPKKRYQWLEEIPDDLICHLFMVTKKLMKAHKKAFNPYYVQILVAGIDVPHVHIHVFPRYENDDREHWNKENYENGESREFASQIRSEITQ